MRGGFATPGEWRTSPNWTGPASLQAHRNKGLPGYRHPGRHREAIERAVDQSVVSTAKDILLGGPRLSARDALHVAAMQSVGAHRIMSFDADFERYPGIERLS